MSRRKKDGEYYPRRDEGYPYKVKQPLLYNAEPKKGIPPEMISVKRYIPLSQSAPPTRRYHTQTKPPLPQFTRKPKFTQIATEVTTEFNPLGSGRVRRRPVFSVEGVKLKETTFKDDFDIDARPERIRHSQEQDFSKRSSSAPKERRTSKNPSHIQHGDKRLSISSAPLNPFISPGIDSNPGKAGRGGRRRRTRRRWRRIRGGGGGCGGGCPFL